LYVLEQETVGRIKECKRQGFPVCLDKALSHIFKEPSTEMLMGKITRALNLGQHDITSALELWDIYDAALDELARVLGKDVSQVIEFQSVLEMESMIGCTNCPLYKRESNDKSLE